MKVGWRKLTDELDQEADFRIPDYLTRTLRFAVLLSWNFECAYCGAADATHVDHVYPRSRGGGHHPRNLVAACPTCNLSKNARVLSFAEYAGILGGIERRQVQFWRIHKHLNARQYHDVLSRVSLRVLEHIVDGCPDMFRGFLRQEWARRVENKLFPGRHRTAVNLGHVQTDKLRELIVSYGGWSKA